MHVRSLTNKINMFVPMPANPSERELLLALISWQVCSVAKLPMVVWYTTCVPLAAQRSEKMSMFSTLRYKKPSVLSVFVRACRKVRSDSHVMWGERSKEEERAFVRSSK